MTELCPVYAPFFGALVCPFVIATTLCQRQHTTTKEGKLTNKIAIYTGMH